MTQSFFARGEEQEATGYENLAPDDPLLVPREVEFDSFDKIPRRRGSLFAIAVSTLVLVAIGFVTWRSFYYLSKPASSVAAASRAMVQAPSAEPVGSPPQPAPMSIVPASQPPQAMSEAQPATEAAPVTPVAQPAPAQPAPVAQPALVAQPAPSAQPAPAQPAPILQHAAKRATADQPAHGRHAALHGYVWSPEKHTLVPAEPAVDDPLPRRAPMRGYVWSPDKHTIVPAEPAAEDSLPSKDPGTRSLDGAPGGEPQPQLAPAPTSPAPFRPSPPSKESAPIID